MVEQTIKSLSNKLEGEIEESFMKTKVYKKYFETISDVLFMNDFDILIHGIVRFAGMWYRKGQKDG